MPPPLGRHAPRDVDLDARPVDRQAHRDARAPLRLRDRAVVDHERRVGGRRRHLRGRARLGARADADQHQPVVDDQRHARRQLAGRRVLGRVDRLLVGRRRRRRSARRRRCGADRPRPRPRCAHARGAPARPPARRDRRCETSGRRCRAGRRRRRWCRRRSAPGPVSSVRKRQSAPRRISAVVVASTFWFDAGSISVASRCEKNSRPVRASMTRMPTRIRPSTPPRRISRSAACMRTMRSRSRSSGGRLGRVVGAARGGDGGAAERAVLATDVPRRSTRRPGDEPPAAPAATPATAPIASPRAPEPRDRVAMLRRPGVAVRGARPDEVAAARSAAHHAPLRILVVLVRDPLPDVAAEIEHAVGAGARRVLPTAHRPPGFLSAHGPSPSKLPQLPRAQSASLPHGYSRPSSPRAAFSHSASVGSRAAREPAVGLRVVPVDVGHRQLRDPRRGGRRFGCGGALQRFAATQAA